MTFVEEGPAGRLHAFTFWWEVEPFAKMFKGKVLDSRGVIYYVLI